MQRMIKTITIRYALCALLALVPGANALAANWQNSIKSVTAQTVDANTVALRVSLDKAPDSQPESFTLSSPSRVIIDFPATANGVGRSLQEVNQGELRNLEIIQGENRTRLVLNLNQPQPYAIKLDGNDYLITLQSRPVSANTGASRFAAESASEAQKHSLRDIDFRRGKHGEARIQIELSDANIGIDVRRQGRNLLVDFSKTQIPAKLQHKLDVVDFGTPVQMIDTFVQGDNTQMVIEPKGLWEFSSYQTDRRFVVEVKPIVEDPNKLAKAGMYSGDKLSLNFQNITVREALNVIADFTNMNIVISDSVSGSLTLRLKEVPWDQALDIIMQSRGLDMRKHGNVVQIAPREELAAKEKLALTAKQEISELESLHTESIQLNYQQADAIAAILSNDKQRILSKRGSVVVDARTNTLFVQDTASQLEAVRKLVKQIDVSVRQVMIEARIIEATDKFGRDLGARLGYGSTDSFGVGGLRGNLGANQVVAPAGVTNPINGVVGGTYTAPANLPGVNLPVANAAGTFSMLLFNKGLSKLLSLEITAQETDGKSRVISSPRVVTADQKEAVIEQGTEIPYQTVAAIGAPPTVAFKKASLMLKVKPQITPDENVIMNVSITKDTVGTLYVLGVPTVDTNKVETQVLVENGGTVMIGGVHTQTDLTTTKKVPVLGDVPVLGVLFKNTSRTDNKGELLIFLSPKVLKDSLNLR
jgi:type IV pilus assembly protein PilQ